MPEARDAVDAVLLGLFLFGLLLTVATLLLGVADLGFHHIHVQTDSDGGNPLHASLGAILVFLSWLGGVGYVLRRVLEWPLLLVLPVAAAAGIGVAALVQRAIRTLSDPTGSVLDPEEYRLPGTLGHVSSPIRAGGTGEVVYEKGGVRHVVAARAADAAPLARGAEVLVLRVERGIATVEAFDPFDTLAESGSKEALPDRTRAP